jgi:hypothetical protein
MFSAAEESLVSKTDRKAMERNLKDVHKRLDEYEGELAAYYAAVQRTEARRNERVSRAAS